VTDYNGAELLYSVRILWKDACFELKLSRKRVNKRFGGVISTESL